MTEQAKELAGFLLFGLPIGIGLWLALFGFGAVFIKHIWDCLHDR